MKYYLFAAVFVAPLLMLAGCVSLTEGNEQTITFHLEPKEAQCVISRRGKDISAISYDYNTLRVSKSKEDLVTVCTAPGYQRQIVNLRSETQARGVIGGIFTDYGVTDMSTGAMWRYPDDATVILQRQ